MTEVVGWCPDCGTPITALSVWSQCEDRPARPGCRCPAAVVEAARLVEEEK